MSTLKDRRRRYVLACIALGIGVAGCTDDDGEIEEDDGVGGGY